MQKLKSPNHAFLPIAIVLAAVLLPRLMLLGGYPATDDGFYTYSSMVAYRSLSAGNGLPSDGMLLLYPTLLSWVFAFDINHFFAVRMADMIVAAISAFMLYRLLRHESGSRMAGALLTAGFVFLLNIYPFIQSGYRNSQFAAYIPLLAALSIALHKPHHQQRDWFLCGILLALCVLLRENFVPFALYGTLCLLVWKGFRAAVSFVVGGTITAIIFFALFVALRHGFESILFAYQEMREINNAPFMSNLKSFFRSFDQSLGMMSGGVSLAAIASILPLLMRRPDFYIKEKWRIAFWLGLALVPLAEPILKKGIVYHYSVCLIGLSGFCALLLRSGLDYSSPRRLWFGGFAAGILFCILSAPHAVQMKELFYERTVPNLGYLTQNGWSDEAYRQNRYLQIASYLKEQLPPGGQVAVSGSLYTVYAILGIEPPTYTLKELNLAYKMLGVETVISELQRCPPDAIFYKKGSPADVFSVLPEYRPVVEIDYTKGTDYGKLAGTVYVRDPAAPRSGTENCISPSGNAGGISRN